jgi:predicted esterase
VRQLWFVVHGHSQLAGPFLQDFSILDDGTRLIVAPEALSRFYLETTGQGRHGHRVGATWMTREDREAEIADYVAYLDALAAHVSERLGGPTPDTRVLGFSQGGATVSRWVSMGSTRIRELILWGSLIPEDVLGAVERMSPAPLVTLVHGTEDTLVPPELRIRQTAALRQSGGIACREWTFAGGHRLDEEVLKSLAAEARA